MSNKPIIKLINIGKIPIQIIDGNSNQYWILFEGVWNDNGVWDDDSLWVDKIL